MATDLFDRTLARTTGDAETDALMRKVWTPTPWMIDVYTGSCDEPRQRAILHWCYATLGEQASPIHRRTGNWQRGCATVFGWTWFGFASEALMRQFVETWPTPAGIVHPGAGAVAAQICAGVVI